MARDLREFPRLTPSILNCNNSNRVHGSGWASNAKGKGLNKSISGNTEKSELLIRSCSSRALYGLDMHGQN